MLQLDPKTTALVLIDLQKGIALRPLAPRPGTEIIDRASELAKRFRSAGAAVVLVNVAFAKDFADAVRVPVDSPMQLPPDGIPDDFSELVVGLAMATDIRVTKRQWGAFYGTELDLQLRRRGIETIVLCGISTNIGVESTARFAYEYGYQQIFIEDAMTSGRSKEDHESAINNVFPRMGRVRKTEDILAELK